MYGDSRDLIFKLTNVQVCFGFEILHFSLPMAELVAYVDGKLCGDLRVLMRMCFEMYLGGLGSHSSCFVC